jgi:hypothetical protein
VGIRVEVTDLATGEKTTTDVPPHEYMILCTGRCHVAHTQAYPGKGTHADVVTLAMERGPK